MKKGFFVSFLLVALVALVVPQTSFATDDGLPTGTKIKGVLNTSTNGDRGQLTTLFAANNGYRGNMFDIEPIVDITEISALDVNVDPTGVACEVDVWWREGTCVGHDQDPTGWELLGQGSGTAAGYDLPTFIDLAGNGVGFSAGQTYGIYVDITNYSTCGINYTNATVPGEYSNSELKAITYYGKGDPPFTGSTFSYREWNGTIYYETGPPPPLKVVPSELSLYFGGTAEFTLTGGIENAGRFYGLFGTLSGTDPGTPLPGGLVTLPINWDWFTDLMVWIGTMGMPDPFFGNLDKEGNATIEFTLKGNLPHPDDYLSYWAYCLAEPFDYVSNAVELLFTGYVPPDEYRYDDGSTENLLGYYAGGDMCWANNFEVIPGHETLDTIGTIWGSATYPGYGPGNGATGYLAIWETTGNTATGAVLASGPHMVTTTEYDNDVTVYYSIPAVTITTSHFFVGAWINSAAGQYVYPMDESQNPTIGTSWFFGTSGGTFDYVTLTNNSDAQTMQSMGWDCYATARAK